MITGKSPERRPMALAAVRSFLAQNYAPMELLIINDGGIPLMDVVSRQVGGLLIREMAVEKQPTLGHLRNIGLENANGEYIAQWDDDDWSHPDRIAYQMEYAKKLQIPVTLEAQIRYSFKSNNAFVVRQYPRPDYAVGIPGTVLHPKTDLRYPEEALHEDTHFLKQFEKVHIIHNSPTLYIRFSHGANSWDEKHIMGSYSSGRDKNSLGPISKRYLGEVLEKHYLGI
jgi:glycosyltransferase involved in cell wall biosynthesis